MTEPKPLLPLTSREVQCAIARAAMHVDPFDGAMASCSWIFRLRGEWSRTPTSHEVAAMLEEMRREPERAPVTAARAIDVLEVVEERDRYRALLERVVDADVKCSAVKPGEHTDAWAKLSDAIAEARKELGL